jgi:glycosyltransferase involved in cell wall biosynthesis
VDQREQRPKATTETLVALSRVVPVSMSAKDIDAAFEVLERLGYIVSYIACGECDEDDLLVELHSCHLDKLNVLFDEDGLDPTTDLI